jgi:hypothetical protein
MTLGARFEVSNSPVLMGDLLIWGTEKSGAPLKLPTIDDITEIYPQDSGWCPNGVQQNIAIISWDSSAGITAAERPRSDGGRPARA